MNSTGNILLTNDDGIDSPGIEALYEHLREVGTVTVVAPEQNQSWSGLTRTWHDSSVPITDHERGYAVGGTPTDCVAIGLNVLDEPVDLVVSGCNEGPNLGTHILGRSGTVGAALEAAYLGVPSMAVSMYDRTAIPKTESTYEEYITAAETAAELARYGLEHGGFGPADLLNVNAPANGTRPEVEITEPSREYEIGVAERTSTEVRLRDRYWDEFLDLDVSDPEGTDRAAVVDGNVSISPLSGSLSPETEALPDDIRDPDADSLG